MNGATVAGDNILGDGQTETAAFSLAGNHRQENGFAEIARYASAAVGNVDLYHQRVG